MHGGDIYRNSIQYDFSVNINPMGMPSEVQWVLTEAALYSNRYPDIYHERLIEETSGLFNVPKENIVYGNGASEIIMAVCHAISPKKALFIAPCFSGYETCVKGACPDCSLSYYTLSEDNDFEIHHDILEHIQVEKADLMFLTNPNNPNGRLISKELLDEIVLACEEAGTTLVVDECFLALTGMDRENSLAYEIKEHKSLIVLRAYTKTFAIPGVRIGYSICSNESIATSLKNHLPEWNLSVFAQMAGVECLKHMEYLEDSVKLIESERRYLTEGLGKLGAKVYTSDANYILFRCNDLELEKKILQYSILIRECSDYNGLEKGFYRVAVKSHGDNEKLLIALEDLLND
ncbi:aminotransferase class I/II-fold pyridoxal phosphate-dependent enzyme [Butyrivibrio fibrisolvens]|uniref:pyridoxal phosphate-dependent aminotransferase n=1 Tax=Pseudobutyrivibrio ruminis TaxID=46206 RepID=UPI0005633E59|nr:histidinol-phosphate transaminase [Pseudobutyrivibrio ruminis]MDC7277974.1 aminotransferase class I/II-fold pyridoxal phosphate-dependent enzyme [Butyrivibrio fibrisolvens]